MVGDPRCSCYISDIPTSCPTCSPNVNVFAQYTLPSLAQTGWICPKCGKVYAPFISQCWNCGNETITTTTGTSDEIVPTSGGKGNDS